MEINMDDTVKMKTMMTKHDIASSKQKFQSDDSEGSDLNYESSFSDEDQNYGGRVQFFKQEMARFFINYPELINDNIIQNEKQEQESSNEEEWKQHQYQSKNEQVNKQGKEPSASLEDLAKRIALYRSKMEQTDIIDLLLQQKDNIMKEIDIEMAHKKNQKNLIGNNEKQENNAQKVYQQDNLYYSWRKRKQFEFKINCNQRQNKPTRCESVATFNKQNCEDKQKSVQKFHRSLHKNGTVHNSIVKDKSKNSKFHEIRRAGYKVTNPFKGHKKHTQYTGQTDRQEGIDDNMIGNQKGQSLMTNWRHLANFQPKTQIGKQLCEDVKKKNSPSDQLGIKKTIIDFLVSYKQLINNEVINKVTLSQKIQKLYTEDAKQLLMFYPSKIGSFDSMSGSASNFKDNNVDEKFIELLKNITEGPLIKYWRHLQESKI